ncbi:hypothetical protein [Burkholderia contaminans]|uniref:hypothetical protein n=1 Tax=Burkholderia contaminans TaxID=488447 RepID=UPI00158A1B08|nr:hypothetical protein [Burkholderia contaminans]
MKKKIALAVAMIALSATTFAGQKDEIQIIGEIDSCKQITIQYLQTSKAWKEDKIKTVVGDVSHGEYDPQAVDQLYTVFDLPEQKRQAQNIVIKAFQDKDPVDLIQGNKGSCTVQVKVKDLS